MEGGGECMELPVQFSMSLRLSSRSGELRTQKLEVPRGENSEPKRSPLKAWSKSVYSHTCYAYRQGFLLIHTISVHSPAFFFQKPLLISPVLAVANTWFLCRPAE